MLSVSEMERHNAVSVMSSLEHFCHCTPLFFGRLLRLAPLFVYCNCTPALLWDEQLKCNIRWSSSVQNAELCAEGSYQMQNVHYCIGRAIEMAPLSVYCTLLWDEQLKCNILWYGSVSLCRIALSAEEPQCKIVEWIHCLPIAIAPSHYCWMSNCCTQFNLIFQK